MDSNGYNKSILETAPDQCYVCGKQGSVGDFARHEVFYGTERKKSKAAGLWVYVCPYCHHQIHHNPGKGYDLLLKHQAQSLYEIEHGHAAFMDLIQKNYL